MRCSTPRAASAGGFIDYLETEAVGLLANESDINHGNEYRVFSKHTFVIAGCGRSD